MKDFSLNTIYGGFDNNNLLPVVIRTKPAVQPIRIALGGENHYNSRRLNCALHGLCTSMTLFSREMLAVLLAKLAITTAAATVFGLKLGADAAIAAAVGGLISVANVFYYTFRVLRTTHKDSDTVYIRGLLMTQLSKYAFSVVFIFVSLGVFKLAVVPLIGTFVFTQIAYFFVLATKPRD